MRQWDTAVRNVGVAICFTNFFLSELGSSYELESKMTHGQFVGVTFLENSHFQGKVFMFFLYLQHSTFHRIYEHESQKRSIF